MAIVSFDFHSGDFTRTASAICPDLLTLQNIGEADNLRGRFIRGFFWIMDKVWIPNG